MTRYGQQLGPDLTFLGVPTCDLDDPATEAAADLVVLGVRSTGPEEAAAGPLNDG